MKDFPKDLSKIVEQLKSCHYQTSDALHNLENNTAFIALEEMASQSNESQNTIDNNAMLELALLSREVAQRTLTDNLSTITCDALLRRFDALVAQLQQ